MKRRPANLVCAAFLAYGVISASLSLAQAKPLPEDWRELLRQADELYYYPARMGLRDMSASVNSSAQRELLQQHPWLKEADLQVRFYWQAPDKARFVVQTAARPADATARAFLSSIEALFAGREMLLAPRPLVEITRDFAGFKENKEQVVLIHGVAKSASPELRSFDIWMDPISLRIEQIYQDFTAGAVLLRPEYITQDGRYLLSRQRRIFRDLLTETTLEWERAPGSSKIWVVRSITATTKSKIKGGIPEVSITIEFSDWKINQGVPRGVFP